MMSGFAQSYRHNSKVHLNVHFTKSRILHRCIIGPSVQIVGHFMAPDFEIILIRLFLRNNYSLTQDPNWYLLIIKYPLLAVMVIIYEMINKCTL